MKRKKTWLTLAAALLLAAATLPLGAPLPVVLQHVAAALGGALLPEATQ